MPKLPGAVFWGLLIGSTLAASGIAAQEAPDGRRSTRQSELEVSRWFEEHRDRPAALRAFVQRMPKGGDIHSHLRGTSGGWGT